MHKAPAIIQWLYLSAMAKQPVGRSVFEDAMQKHPEYFPAELEYRRKWDLIPQSVHDEVDWLKPYSVFLQGMV